MGDGSDIFKSIVRSTAGEVFRRLRDADTTKSILKAVGDLKAQKTRIGAQELSAACADITDVQSITIGFVKGAIDVFIERPHDEVSFRVTPAGVRFAPRGAKEIVFSVSPPSACTSSVVSDTVGRIAAEVAARLWTFAPERTGGLAIPDRKEGHFSIDLRDTPTGRALRGTAGEVLLEALEVRSLSVEEDALVVQIGLPLPGRAAKP